MTMTTHPVLMVFISCLVNGSKDKILVMFHGPGAARRIWKDFSGTRVFNYVFPCEHLCVPADSVNQEKPHDKAEQPPL
jgi:hypothetical protein